VLCPGGQELHLSRGCHTRGRGGAGWAASRRHARAAEPSPVHTYVTDIRR
jgi:hypothetical protein